jgi:hypothetical protein
MAQARREPRFSEIEVLPPARSGRPPALDAPDVTDAIFETIPQRAPAGPDRKPTRSAPGEIGLRGLGLLKNDAGARTEAGSEHAGITPGFAVFTILSAIAVFWLCGGHALLY